MRTIQGKKGAYKENGGWKGHEWFMRRKQAISDPAKYRRAVLIVSSPVYLCPPRTMPCTWGEKIYVIFSEPRGLNPGQSGQDDASLSGLLSDATAMGCILSHV